MTANKKVRMWGRKQYLDFLEEQLGRTKSATLIYGDPQVGKSTLVRELKIKLCEDHGQTLFRFGMHKAISTKHDPFVFAISDLLTNIYSWSHIKDQFPIIFKRLKEKLTVSKFKEMCFALLSAAQELPGLKPAGKLIEWLKTEIEGLDLSLKPQSLSAHGVEKILRSIVEACPQNSIVLIIDDYSAAYELGGENIPSVWEHGTLLHLLDENIENVHLILTWKENDETAGPLSKFKQIFLQHSGNVVHLGPLEPSEVREWVQAEFQDIISEIDEDQLVKLIDGLPKVAAELRLLRNVHARTITEMASQIKKGSYDYIHSFLKKCPKIQRDLLMQMAANKLPIESTALAEMMDKDEADIVHSLKLCVERNIVKEIYSELFIFEHDVKQQIVLDHLFRFHSPKPYFKRALTYFEKLIAIASPIPFISRYYVLPVIRSSHVLSHYDAGFSQVETFYRSYLSLPEDDTDQSYQKILEALIGHPAFKGRPISVQRAIYNKLFALCKESELITKHALRALKEIFKVLNSPQLDYDDTLTAIHTLKFVAAYFNKIDNNKALSEILHHLVRIKIDDRTPSKMRIEIAAAILNTTAEGISLEDMQLAVETNKQLSHQSTDENYLQEIYAQTLVNASHLNVNDPEWLNMLTSEIRRVSEFEPATQDLEEACMRGFHDAAVTMHHVGYYEGIDSIFTLVNNFAPSHLKNKEVTRWFARFLFNSTSYFAQTGQKEKAVEALDLLSKVAKANTNKPYIMIDYAQALNNIAVMSREGKDDILMNRVVGELRSLAYRLSDIREVCIEFASGLCNAIYLLFHEKKDRETVQRMMKEFKDYESEKNDSDIASIYADLLGKVFMPKPVSGKFEVDISWGKYLYTEILNLIQRYPKSFRLAEYSSEALANIIYIAALNKKKDWANEILDHLSQLVDGFTQERVLVHNYARALYLAWVTALYIGDHELARSYELLSHKHGEYSVQAFNDFRANGIMPHLEDSH